MMMYVLLIQRLRADAVAAVNAFLKATDDPQGPVSSVTVSRASDGRWVYRVVVTGGWLAGYSGDSCDSEIEAICSLVERAKGDTERAGGIPSTALLEQAESDASAVGVYRAAMTKLGQTFAEVLVALDHEAEASDVIVELRAALG